MTDPYAPSILVTVLHWLITVAALVGLISLLEVGDLVSELTDSPAWFGWWTTACLVILGPFNYFYLNLIYGITILVPSGWSFMMFFYWIIQLLFMVLFGAFYLAIFGCPIYFLVIIRNVFGRFTKARLVLSSVLAPILAISSYKALVILLPYIAIPTHFLAENHKFQASSPPFVYIFEYLIEPFSTIQYSNWVDIVGLENMSATERLRAHVASVYCSDAQEIHYLATIYPQLELNSNSLSPR